MLRDISWRNIIQKLFYPNQNVNLLGTISSIILVLFITHKAASIYNNNNNNKMIYIAP